MASMQKLSADTVRLITSSQVITSVVSVIKELLENSLDASSDNIEIKLENYGFDKIEVRDNGSGIKPVDAQFMARRHFTSKISQHADLESLATYGFRGEALGSLCAVSSVTVVTKTPDDEFGRQYVLDNEGGVVTTRPSHLGNGTTIAATHLFKNVPVRKQYYASSKRRRDELKKVEDLILSYGAVCPAVRFFLTHNRSILWQKSKAANQKAALINTWGSGVMSQMQHVRRLDDNSQVSIEGFVPSQTADGQSVTRALPDRCLIAVNNRPVTFKEIEKMVKQSYCTAARRDTMSVRHLIMFLSITLPQHHVDVNLEPNKTKVLLQNKDAVLSVLSDLLDEVYGQAPDRPATGIANQQSTSRLEDNTTSNTDVLKKRPEHLPDTVAKTNTSGGEVAQSNSTSDMNGATQGCERNSKLGMQQRELGNVVQQECDTPICKPDDKHDKPAESNKLCPLPSLPSSHHPSAAVSSINPSDVSDNLAAQEDNFKLDFSIFEDDFDLESFDGKEVLGGMDEELAGERDPVKGDNSTCLAKEASDSLLARDTSRNPEAASSSLSHTDWSKGRGLKDKDGKPIEPATLLRPQNANEGRLLTNPCAAAGHTTVRNSSEKSVFFYLNQSDSTKSADSCLLKSSSTDRAPGSVGPGSGSPTSSPANQDTAGSSSTANQKESPGKRRLSLEGKIGKGIMFDLVGQSPVRRPQSSYAFFSKEVRPQVAESNPTANFNDVTKIVEERWRQMGEDEKETYEEMARSDTDRYHNQLKAAQKKLGAKQDPSKGLPSKKKKKLSLPANQGLIDQMLLSQQRRKLANELAPPESPDVPVIEVPFSMIGLERCLETQHTRNVDSDQRLCLIGQLASHGVWLARRGNQVVLFNQYRVEETLLHHRLMSHHVLPCQSVDLPIILSPSLVGGDTNWNTLLSMPRRSNPPDPASYITDDRLTANGFEIKRTVDSETQEVKLQVIAMATTISYYGLDDLQEILRMVSEDQQVALSECRPLKVANYLKGEAVRMTRNLPPAMLEDDVQDIIHRMKQLPVDCSRCLHNQPFEHPLHSIPSVQ